MTAQRVLITAGAGGIGRAIVEAFMAKGASVFVCDIDTQGLAKLEADFPGGHTTLFDISSPTEIEKAVALATQTLGGLDVLINNAGLALDFQSIKHLVNPRHIADLAVFITSESGQSISGQILPIDCDMQHA
ncbi:MAG: SDR family oxidoreductase [Negativicutes bacterium]|nr:SDR family oxidoreductase [Negativicutes bacterium]